MSGHPLPLKGFRIVDLTMGWAGPLCTRHLADMGADVIKIEDEVKFDWWRGASHTPEEIAAGAHERTTNYLFMNRNKRGMSIDLTRPEGRELVLSIVAKADAVVENQATGVMTKLGLDYDSLKSANPGITFISLPGFGAEGPWSAFRGYGSTFEQGAGLPHLSGGPNDPPVQLHLAFGDPVGGLTSVSALLVALYHQRKTGEGQRIDLSQVEAIMQLGIHGPLFQAVTGAPPERTGNRHHFYAPQGCYACDKPDTWLVLTVTEDAQWPVLAKAIGRPDLGDDPSLATATGRHDRAAEIDAAIAEYLARQDAVAAARHLLDLGIPASNTSGVSGPVNDPVLESRGFWTVMDRPVTGEMKIPTPPYRIDGARAPVTRPAPWVGQDSAEVLEDVLGLSPARIAKLRKDGVIGPGTIGPRNT